ncbi:hypothetical protein DM01DRAFT_1373393 [Hesseltinella vesiculosa]|uniref:Uncharacterized protein n=1 Tax=Hesseltinella vesiculosa TaxID=101127 RepID=A0A1X2GK76_9FUNG|nr:hypothetical protein DM01DRAFT_1373393 [Hesseltinella vesiculosa]
MAFTHTISECPLAHLPSVTMTADQRQVVGWSKTMPDLISKQDLLGMVWPSKAEQQLCFTTLVDVRSQKQTKRLMTCEHTSADEQHLTVYCCDLAMLEKQTLRQLLTRTSSTCQTTILRLSPYGIIQSAFDPEKPRPWLVGQPLMRFVHNDDIPTLCQGLRQATDPTDEQQDEQQDNQVTLVSFDVRCQFDLHQPDRMPSPHEDLPLIQPRMYHFSTIVTGTQDLLCVIRPHTQGSAIASASTTSLFQITGLKLRHLVHHWQQTLWRALEQGLLLLAHYLALVMVFSLQSYRLATHSSFWLETSELALRCVVAETKSRPELDRLFSWLESTGFKSSRKWFTLALDHGSDWIITMLLRPKTSLPV